MSCLWVEGAVDTSVTLCNTLVSSQNTCFFLAPSSLYTLHYLYTISLPIYIFLYSFFMEELESVKLLLRELHWLPVCFQVQFKVINSDHKNILIPICMYIFFKKKLFHSYFEHSTIAKTNPRGKILSQDWLWKCLEGK